MIRLNLIFSLVNKWFRIEACLLLATDMTHKTQICGSTKKMLSAEPGKWTTINSLIYEPLYTSVIHIKDSSFGYSHLRRVPTDCVSFYGP